MKLAGSDGDLDHLLVGDQIGEAKNRDLGDYAGKTTDKWKSSEAESPGSNCMQQGRGHIHQSASKSSGQCFCCGSMGHFQRQCPMQGCGLPRETRGSRDKIATIVPQEDSPQMTLTEGEWQD